MKARLNKLVLISIKEFQYFQLTDWDQSKILHFNVFAIDSTAFCLFFFFQKEETSHLNLIFLCVLVGPALVYHFFSFSLLSEWETDAV